MKYYIDCVSGYSFLNNSTRIPDEKMEEIVQKFRRCFTDGAVISECGRNVIELHFLLRNISDLMRSIDEKEFDKYVNYNSIRSILNLTLKGIAEIPGNCADDSDHYKQKKDYVLLFCDTCYQMTNHLDGVCQKHKTTKPDNNDYVFASKWPDGDPNDPWYVGFIEDNIEGDGCVVNNKFYRYCLKITKEQGDKILKEYPKLEVLQENISIHDFLKSC